MGGITTDEVAEHNPRLAKTLSRSLEGIEMLARAAENDVARISEGQFVRELLPILVNRNQQQDLSRWQEIAGHGMRAIDVIHDSSGEVLFRVPPLLRSLSRRVTGSGRNSAYEILRTAEQKGKVIPAMGDEHIRSRLANSVEHEPVNVADVEAWNQILKRYGYEPIVETQEEPVEAIQRQQEVKDTFTGEYDEF